ncbi:MAG: glycosyl transferase [Oscillospiraceae bacterium]|nr:glycosyl transferase [Oscillospiraceae bacterium]
MILKNYLKNPIKYSVLSLANHGLLDWMADELYLKLLFRAKMDKKLDLKDPKTFNEKLQWLKLHDRKPEYTRMVDKYEAKQYVAERIGEEYIIPTLGVWDSFDEIDFDSLPDQFVLKCTHDSGGLVICRDKSKLDKAAARKKIERSLKTNYYLSGREWPYKNVKPRIIAEVYMEDENEAQGLTDYKFFCFNGEPRIIYVSQGLEDHSTASISFYDLDGKEMPFHRSDFSPIQGKMTLPANFAEMTSTAQVLAQQVDCPFLRVDLYSVKGQMFFSEITFSPCSGMLPFTSVEWEEKLGEWIKLPKSE